MPDSKYATREEIEATWKHPLFYQESEDDQIAIMSRMDPEFAKLSGQQKRVVVYNQAKRYATPNVPAAPAQPQPFDIEAESRLAMLQSGLYPDSKPPAAPPAIAEVDQSVLGNLPPNPFKRSPQPAASAPARDPFAVTPVAGVPAPVIGAPPVTLPATKPTGSVLELSRRGPFATVLTPSEEAEFKKWVVTNNVPFDPGPQSTYDMRGYWRALRNRDQRAAAGDPLNPPSEWMTPFHPDFSTKSIFAGKDAPKWMGDKLVDAFGRPIRDKAAEREGQKAMAQQQKDAQKLASKGLDQVFQRTPIPAGNVGGGSPVPTPLAEPIMGAGPMGIPGAPAPGVPQTVNWREMQTRPGVEQPDLVFDPMIGGLAPSPDSTPEQLAQFGKDDMFIQGVRSAATGAISMGMTAPGGVLQMAGNATGSEAMRNTGEMMTSVGNQLEEGFSAPPVASFDEAGPQVFVNPAWWGSTIGNGMGTMLPLMASGMGAGALIEKALQLGLIRGRLAEMVIKYGPSAVSGLSEGILAGGSAYLEAKQMGKSEAEAQKAFSIVAAGTAATAIPAFKMGAFNDTLTGGTKVLTSAGTEGIQEVGQRVFENIAADRPLEAGQVENFVGGAFGGVAGAMMDSNSVDTSGDMDAAQRGMQNAFPGRRGPFTPPPATQRPPAPQAAEDQPPPPQSPPQQPTPTPASSPTPAAEAAPQAPPPPPKRKNPTRPAAPPPDIEEIPSDIEEMLDAEEQQAPPAQEQAPQQQPKWPEEPPKVDPVEVVSWDDEDTPEVRIYPRPDGKFAVRAFDKESGIAFDAPITGSRELIPLYVEDSIEKARERASEIMRKFTPPAPAPQQAQEEQQPPQQQGRRVRVTIMPGTRMQEIREGTVYQVSQGINGEPVYDVDFGDGPQRVTSRDKVEFLDESPAPAPAPEPSGDSGELQQQGQDEAPEPYKGARSFVQAVYDRISGFQPGIKDTPTLNKLFRDTTGMDALQDQKRVYDAVEVAVNRVIAEAKHLMAPAIGAAKVRERINELRTFLSKVPTQTTRTEGQIAAQQFSTPPHLAYIAARVAGIRPGMTVLEPSAGTGSLAAFAKAAGADVVTNEWDAGRRGLLQMQGYRTFGENAEHLHAILPDDIQPDVVLMNPPFSASVVRGGANTNQTGYQHVLQGLRRLKPGGRLVAILGEGARMGNPNGRKFWEEMRARGTVRADVGISGEEYRKYGTTFGNRLIVIDKHPATGAPAEAPAPVRGEYNSIEEAWDAISGIAQPNNAGGSAGSDPGGIRPGGGEQAAPGGGGSGVSGQPSGTGSGSGSSGTSVSGGKTPRAPKGTKRPTANNTPEGPGGGVSGGSQSGPTSPSPQPVGGLSEEEARNQAMKQLAEEADADIKAGEDALRDLGFYTSLGSMNLDPRAIPALVQIGLGFAKKGIISFRRWSDAMLEKLAGAAERVRPHLRDIYDRVIEEYEKAVEAVVATLTKPKQDEAPPPDSEPPQQQDAAGEEEQSKTLQDDGDFTIYVAKVPSEWQAKPHKAKIVETQSMAGVRTPEVTIKPNIDDKLIKSGELSDVQLVSISRAAQAFSMKMPDGQRIGYFVGDGTGVGKGRQIAGTILHLWNSGVRQIVWVSYNETLMNDAKRDLTDLSANIPIRWLGDIKVSDNIKRVMPEGIIFAGYSTLASMSNEDRKKSDRGYVPFRRARQILEWAGENPMFIFDEAHKAKNAGATESGRGQKQGTNSGRAVLALQNERPGAYVLYSSATGFTEPENLIYAQRLGLWGKGTSFDSFMEFKQQIQSGGIGAMEIVARDLKAQGRYESRFISYGKDENGVPVEFDEVEHTLTGPQNETLDKAAEAWRIVREKMWEAFESTDAPAVKRGRVASQFYGAMQRFYMTVLTSMKAPTMFKEIDASLERGEQVIISVLLTGEAAQERALQEQQEKELSLDDLDMSPAKMLQDLVDKVFPTQQYETQYDEDGNPTQVAVVDSNGDPVLNPDAVAAKNELLQSLNDLRMPDTAIDQVINRYGSSVVAELTGRDRRIETDPKSGLKVVVERKGEDLIKMEADAFQNGDKKIAIISPASSTGISLHASNRAKNKGRRRHIILQLMWSADQQMQVFGRSHRTDQAIPPHYTLLTMNVGGEKRFASSIARRLEQLGALSRGDRSSSGAGSIANYNFESNYGHKSANIVMRRMVENGDLGGRDTVKMMGLERLIPNDSDQKRKKDSEEVEVKQFLNRLTVLPLSLQNRVFDAFMDEFESAIETAKANGTFDSGAEKINADSIVEKAPPVVVRTDEATGAQTVWYQIEARKKRNLLPWEKVKAQTYAGYRLMQNPSGTGLALVALNARQSTDETGAQRLRFSAQRPNGDVQSLSPEDVAKWTPIEPDEFAAEKWREQMEAADPYTHETHHLIGGSVLPIYSVFAGQSESRSSIPKVKIANLDNGTRILGVKIMAGRIRQVLRAIGYGSTVDVSEVYESLAAGENAYQLSNNVILQRTMIQGEHVIQLVNVPAQDAQRFKALGAKNVMVDHKWRYFIPIRDGKPILEAILKAFPPQRDSSGSIEYGNAPEVEEENESPRRGPRAVSESRRADQGGMMRPDLFTAPLQALAQRMRRGPAGVKPLQGDYFKLTGESEDRVQNAGKPMEEVKTTAQKLSEFAESWNGIWRVYRNLPREKYGRLIFELKKLEKSVGVASSQVLIDLTKAIGELSPEQYELFRKAVILDDLVETVDTFQEQGEALPDKLAFGYDEDTLRADHQRAQDAVAADPAVRDAMTNRRRMWASIKREYMGAMRAIGEDMSEKLKRQNYYRHRVLLVKRLERLAAANPQVESPNRRSFLKGRRAENVGKDYATNFVQTEMDVMTQLLVDTRTAKFIRFLDENLNIISDLKQQAKDANVRAVMPYFADLARQANADLPPSADFEYTAEDMFRQVLNTQQAIALNKLGKMAARGALPDTADGKYSRTIENLATAYIERRARREGDEGPSSSELEVDGDLFKYLSWLMRRGESDEASGRAAQFFKGVRAKQQAIKRIAGDQFVTWEDLLPEGYEKHQIDPRRAFYTVFTIPEQLAMKIMEDQAEEAGVTAADIGKAQAVGAQRDPMVLPAEVVKQFKEMEAEVNARREKNHQLLDAARSTMAHYKRYLLLAPQRVTKYLLRNQSGDMDAMLAGLPTWATATTKGLKELAWKHQSEVKDYFLPILKGDLKNVKMTDELRTFAEFGAFEGLLASVELDDGIMPDVLEEFTRWEQKLPPKTFRQKYGPKAMLKGYFRRAEVVNNWREAANRYSVYRVFLEDIKRNNGKPSSYSASIKAEVDALPTAQEKAYRMSNDLMGAYDEVSIAGQVLRTYLIPFWSYQELNFKRYFRLISNGVREGMDDQKFLGVNIRGAARAPYFAYKMGGTATKLLGMWALWAALNALFSDDDDKELRKEVRSRAHLTFGKVNNETIYFPRIGNIADILEWVDLEESIDNVRAAWEGRKPWHTAVFDILRGGPGEKLFLSAGHHVKYLIEGATNKTYFPNVDRPRAVESWPEKIAQDAGAGDFFRYLTGRPRRQESWGQKAADLVIYRADPNESAYYDILELQRSWLRKQGEAENEFTSNKPTTIALRNIKKALRYRDQAAFNKYMLQYIELGGTPKGLDDSVQFMHPLNGLKNKEKREEFLESLSEDDKRKLDMALDYYDDTFSGETAEKYMQEFDPERKP